MAPGAVSGIYLPHRSRLGVAAPARGLSSRLRLSLFSLSRRSGPPGRRTRTMSNDPERPSASSPPNAEVDGLLRRVESAANDEEVEQLLTQLYEHLKKGYLFRASSSS